MTVVIFDTIASYDFLNFLCGKEESAKGSSEGIFSCCVERPPLLMITVNSIILDTI